LRPTQEQGRGLIASLYPVLGAGRRTHRLVIPRNNLRKRPKERLPTYTAGAVQETVHIQQEQEEYITRR